MPSSPTIPNHETLQHYQPLTTREIAKIRRWSLVRAFVCFLGVLLPVLALCVVAVLGFVLYGQPLWHSVLLLCAMLLLGDMVLGRRQIGWLRRNVTMMLTGAAGYFMTMPWHGEVLPNTWSPVDIQATSATFFLLGGVVCVFGVQSLVRSGVHHAQRAFLFKKDPLSPQSLHDTLNQQGISAFNPFFSALEQSGRPYMTRAEVMAIVTVLNQLRARMAHEKNRPSGAE